MRESLPVTLDFALVQKAAEGIHVSTMRRASAAFERAHGGNTMQHNNANGSCWADFELKSVRDSFACF